jgi:hypothetical protein
MVEKGGDGSLARQAEKQLGGAPLLVTILKYLQKCH